MKNISFGVNRKVANKNNPDYRQFIDRFIPVRVRFSQSPSFTSKYYLNTDNKINVQKEFNAAFLNAFAKARDLMLVTNKEDFIIGFNRSISLGSSRAIFKILKAAEFLGLTKLESA